MHRSRAPLPPRQSSAQSPRVYHGVRGPRARACRFFTPRIQRPAARAIVERAPSVATPRALAENIVAPHASFLSGAIGGSVSVSV